MKRCMRGRSRTKKWRRLIKKLKTRYWLKRRKKRLTKRKSRNKRWKKLLKMFKIGLTPILLIWRRVLSVPLMRKLFQIRLWRGRRRRRNQLKRRAKMRPLLTTQKRRLMIRTSMLNQTKRQKFRQTNQRLRSPMLKRMSSRTGRCQAATSYNSKTTSRVKKMRNQSKITHPLWWPVPFMVESSLQFRWSCSLFLAWSSKE